MIFSNRAVAKFAALPTPAPALRASSVESVVTLNTEKNTKYGMTETTKDRSVEGANKSICSGLAPKEAKKDDTKSGGDTAPPHPHFDPGDSPKTYPAFASDSFMAASDYELDKATNLLLKPTIEAKDAISEGDDSALESTNHNPISSSGSAGVAGELIKADEVKDAMSGGDAEPHHQLHFKLESIIPNPILSNGSADELAKAALEYAALGLKATVDDEGGTKDAMSRGDNPTSRLFFGLDSTNVRPTTTNSSTQAADARDKAMFDVAALGLKPTIEANAMSRGDDSLSGLKAIAEGGANSVRDTPVEVRDVTTRPFINVFSKYDVEYEGYYVEPYHLWLEPSTGMSCELGRFAGLESSKGGFFTDYTAPCFSVDTCFDKKLSIGEVVTEWVKLSGGLMSSNDMNAVVLEIGKDDADEAALGVIGGKPGLNIQVESMFGANNNSGFFDTSDSDYMVFPLEEIVIGTQGVEKGAGESSRSKVNEIKELGDRDDMGNDIETDTIEQPKVMRDSEYIPQFKLHFGIPAMWILLILFLSVNPLLMFGISLVFVYPLLEYPVKKTSYVVSKFHALISFRMRSLLFMLVVCTMISGVCCDTVGHKDGMQHGNIEVERKRPRGGPRPQPRPVPRPQPPSPRPQPRLPTGSKKSDAGKDLIQFLEKMGVQRGATWNIWDESYAENDWIVQHPPTEYLGKPSSSLPVAKLCGSEEDCNRDFKLFKCNRDSDCEKKDVCPVHGDESGPEWTCPEETPLKQYFARGICKELDSTRKGVGLPREKLCVGHSYELYERMYNHIIQAQRFVDITSLDSFDTIGTGGEGYQFMAAIRNAITYLASTGKTITVRCHFGSIPLTTEDTEAIAKELVRDWAMHKDKNKVDLHVTTYILNVSWNHGKIIAVDGDKLFTGGTNYYSSHYLWEDPVTDVSLQVRGEVAVTAHEFANMLHRGACEISTKELKYIHSVNPVPYGGLRMIDDTTHNGHITDDVGYHWETADGSLPDTDTMGCPPRFNIAMHQRKSANTQGSPFRIIPVARLAELIKQLDSNSDPISVGEKTSDLAMYSMITSAKESVKLSQQDMLPIYMFGAAAYVSANKGYSVSGTTGITVFDDTWRLIEAISIALSKRVTVSLMLSAPCAIGADPATFYAEANPIFGGVAQCQQDGTQGNGYDYWARVYRKNNNAWPMKRDVDKCDYFLCKSDLRKDDIEFHDNIISPDRRLTEGGYGYGWSLDNVADWIYAYLAIFPEKRPKDEDGNPISDGEVVNLICQYSEIGHVRMSAQEETFKRYSEDGVFRGGQVGNHAKVVMADDSIFYVGSDNAYGAGLAEFGIVIDDIYRAGDFASTYWTPRWNELLGTIESPGLVTGKHRLAAGCPWKERLPVRNEPWSSISLVLAYGDGMYLSLASSSGNSRKWLGLIAGNVKVMGTRLGNGASVGDLDRFRWTIRSKLNHAVPNQNPRVLKMSPDPMAGSCIKYGDIVYLQNNIQNNLWLSGGRGMFSTSLYLDDHTNVADENYQWIVRSSDRSQESLAGKCVTENDEIYLQVKYVKPPIWGGSATKSRFLNKNGDLANTPVNGVQWTVELSPANMGEPCGEDEHCDSGYCSRRGICEPLVPHGERCYENDDCISGRCESIGLVSIIKTCQRKKIDGEKCNEHSDCQGGECTWDFECGKSCDMGDCGSHEFCGGIVGTCKPKKSDGEVCVPGFSQCQGTCFASVCGTTCDNDDDCGEDQQCGKGLSPTAAFRCHPKSDRGGPCLQDRDCMDEGDRCNTVLKKCGQGCFRDKACDSKTELCNASFICVPKRDNGDWCDSASDCKSGVCKWAGCRPSSECIKKDDACGTACGNCCNKKGGYHWWGYWYCK